MHSHILELGIEGNWQGHELQLWTAFSDHTDPGAQSVEVGDGAVSEDVPRVSLEEMLQEMTIT